METWLRHPWTLNSQKCENMQAQNVLPAPHWWMWPSELFLEERPQDFLLPPGAEQTLRDGFPGVPQWADVIQIYTSQSPVLFLQTVPFTRLRVPE